MFQYPIPDHTLAEWKANIAVDSYMPTMFARATALSLKESIDSPTGHISPEGNRETSEDNKIHILELANTLQDMLGEAMATTTAMFPHKVAPPPPGALFHAISGLNRFDMTSPKFDDGQRQCAV